jgi:glutaredoxin
VRTVVVYGRPGCHLCEDALEVVRRVQKRVAFVLEERNIEADDALLMAYLERIPVVTIDGRESFELFVDETALERAVIGHESALDHR